jgi:cbb3-type cytochrome oxidase maturation protein
MGCFVENKNLDFMGIIYLLIGISLVMGTFFLGAFFWAFRSGQFEDTCTPGMRILDFQKTKDISRADLATNNK